MGTEEVCYDEFLEIMTVSLVKMAESVAARETQARKGRGRESWGRRRARFVGDCFSWWWLLLSTAEARFPSGP